MIISYFNSLIENLETLQSTVLYRLLHNSKALVQHRDQDKWPFLALYKTFKPLDRSLISQWIIDFNSITSLPATTYFFTFFFMSKQIINGSIFRPTLRKANFAVSNQKKKKSFFQNYDILIFLECCIWLMVSHFEILFTFSWRCKSKMLFSWKMGQRYLQVI